MSSVGVELRSKGKPGWSTALVGLGIALGGFSLPWGSWDDEFKDLTHVIGNELIYWAFPVVILLYVMFIERQPLASIGFRKFRIKDILIAIATGILIVACLAAIYYVVFPALHWTENGQLGTVLKLPYWLQVLIVIRAAVTEEILFRGYAIERIQGLTGSRVVAATIPWAIFTFDHVGFWGWHHIFVAGSAGMLLTLLYLWRRNTWANMLAHFLVDATAFLA